MLKQIDQQKKRQILTFFIVPTVIWIVLFLSRPFTYSLSCAQDPTPCVIDSINSLDQAAFLVRSIRGDFYSNVIQNTIGVVAFLLPWLFFYFRRQTTPQALRESLTDCGILLSSMMWNGAILEFVRFAVQRPRPLVYDSPLTEGLNALQYTSFYSGHTSFVALATLNIFFTLKKKTSNERWLALSLLNFAFWTCMTGFLRVYGGRHYPTDVIFGAVAGTLIAAIIEKFFIIRSDRA